MYSMRYMHRYDKDTTACRSKKQNYERGTPADFLTVSAYESQTGSKSEFLWDPTGIVYVSGIILR